MTRSTASWCAIAAAIAVHVLGARTSRAGDSADARPFGLMDLATTSSVGVSAAVGRVRLSDYENHSFLIGELALDGELTLGGGVKLFASMPISYLEDAPSRLYGHGNLTVGLAGLRRAGDTTLSAGASASFLGSEEGRAGLYLRRDVTGYAEAGTLVRLFGAARARTGRGVLQAQVDYKAWDDGHGETGFGRHHLVEARLGGDVPVAPTIAIAADVGVLYFLGRGGVIDPVTVFVANAGVRGRVGAAARASWAARASVQTGDGYTTVAIGLELRADLAAR